MNEEEKGEIKIILNDLVKEEIKTQVDDFKKQAEIGVIKGALNEKIPISKYSEYSSTNMKQSISYIILIIFGFIVAWTCLNAFNEEIFDRLKDLLMYVGVFVGCVVTYYLTKKSEEGEAQRQLAFTDLMDKLDKKLEKEEPKTPEPKPEVPI